MSCSDCWPESVPGELRSWGPAIIGGTGGSGTRAVAGMLRRAGMYLGTQLNESDDSPDFGRYSDRWVNLAGHLDATELPPGLEEEMLSDLSSVLEHHLSGLERPRPWGWKEPRSAFLLPFFIRHLPSLRFLHVVRDGRDMAFSDNQNQLREHGSLIGLPDPDLSPPAQSLKLWSWLNTGTARLGAEVLGERYLRVRFEDLCSDPVAAAGKILEFFWISADPVHATSGVVTPETLGRWRSRDPEILDELSRVGREALREFGYSAGDELVGSGSRDKLRR